MAAISAFPCLSWNCKSNFPGISIPSPSSTTSSIPSLPCLRLGRSIASSASSFRYFVSRKKNPERRRRIWAVEEETQISEGAVEDETEVPEVEEEAPPAEQPVSVPVSPSDMLTMFFKAEGTMNESAVSTVKKALEETEGITDLNVEIHEGIACVELTKQTTVQATGVASSLMETIQGSGFRLQTLNLSFEDEEDTNS